MQRTIIKIIRCGARSLSIIIFLFHALSFLGDQPMAGLTEEDILKLGIWGFLLVGMVVAWKWEGIGSLIIIGVPVVQFIMNPELFSIWLMWIASFTGILFFICWSQTKENIRRQSKAL